MFCNTHKRVTDTQPHQCSKQAMQAGFLPFLSLLSISATKFEHIAKPQGGRYELVQAFWGVLWIVPKASEGNACLLFPLVGIYPMGLAGQWQRPTSEADRSSVAPVNSGRAQPSRG